MAGDLETIELSDEGGRPPAPAAGPRLRSRPASPAARRFRRQALAGFAVTILAVGALAAAAYVLWVAASIRQVDLVYTEAISLDEEIHGVELTWDDRFLPEEAALERQLTQKLDGGRRRLLGVTGRLERLMLAPDRRVQAYRRAAVAAMRARAEDEDWRLAADSAVLQARRAARRWPAEPDPPVAPTRFRVVDAGLRRRLPDPFVLFAGDCRCRLLASEYTGRRTWVDIWLDATPHRLKRSSASPSSTGAPLGDSSLGSLGMPFEFDGRQVVVRLHNGADLRLEEGVGFPLIAGDGIVVGGWPHDRPLTLISLADGSRRTIGTEAERARTSVDRHVFVTDRSNTSLRVIDTASLTSERWAVPASVGFVEQIRPSPDGTRVALVGVVAGRWSVLLVDRDASTVIGQSDRAHGHNLGHPSWTPDGQWVFWLQGQSGSDTDSYTWIRGAPADGSSEPLTVRARGRYRALIAAPK